MVVMSKILEIVVDIRRSVNFVVLSLSICDLESVCLGEFLVFSEIGSNQRSISLGIVCCEKILIQESGSEERKHSPS